MKGKTYSFIEIVFLTCVGLCCEFVWVTVMSCSEASLSQCSSPFFGFSHSFFPHGLPDRSLSLEASKDHTKGSSVPRHSWPVILGILNSLNLRVYFLYKEFYKPNKKCSVFIQKPVLSRTWISHWAHIHSAGITDIEPSSFSSSTSSSIYSSPSPLPWQGLSCFTFALSKLCNNLRFLLLLQLRGLLLRRWLFFSSGHSSPNFLAVFPTDKPGCSLLIFGQHSEKNRKETDGGLLWVFGSFFPPFLSYCLVRNTIPYLLSWPRCFKLYLQASTFPLHGLLQELSKVGLEPGYVFCCFSIRSAGRRSQSR